MSFYPYNPNLGQQSQTDAPGVTVNRFFGSRYAVIAANALPTNGTAVHAAVTDTGSQQVITTGFTNPSVPRNLIAVAGGTAGDVKAIQVIVDGTDFAGNAISETLPAFTVNTPGTVTGSKAFKTVTAMTIPAHDGTGATTSLGFGEKLGLPDKLTSNTVLMASLGGTKEATPPTVTVSGSVLADNTVDLNSALNSSAVDIYYFV